MIQTMSQGQKLTPLEKVKLFSYRISDANYLMTNVQGGDILARKRIFPYYQFWLGDYMQKMFQIM